MATKKKAAPKSAAKKPASVLSVNKSKFKKKSSDGGQRRGRKMTGVLVESSKLIDLIINGPAPRVIPGLIKRMIEKVDNTAKKKIILYVLSGMDEKARTVIVKRYCSGIKLTDEQKKLIRMGKQARKLFAGE